MANNEQSVKIFGGRSVVQFSDIDQRTGIKPLPVFDPANVEHLLTVVDEPINGWKTWTHTFQARTRDYADAFLEPFIESFTSGPPELSCRFGLVSGSEANWRPWEDQVLIAHSLKVRPDPNSGPVVTVKTADRLWLTHTLKQVKARRGPISDVISQIWATAGGQSTLIEPTVLAGHANNTGVWYQAFESDWSFMMRTMLPLAINADGVSSFRIFVRDNVLRFHSPGFGANTPKKLLYTAGTAGFSELEIEDRFTEMVGGAGAAGMRRAVYDPSTGVAQMLESDSSHLIKFAGARPKYTNFDYRTSHVGDNLVSAENSRNQQFFSALSSEVFTAAFTSDKCMDIRVGDVLDVVLAANLAETALYTGLWLVNRAQHTLNRGGLHSTYVATRGELNLPSQKNILGADDFNQESTAAGVNFKPSDLNQVDSGQTTVNTDDGVLVPIQS